MNNPCYCLNSVKSIKNSSFIYFKIPPCRSLVQTMKKNLLLAILLAAQTFVFSQNLQFRANFPYSYSLANIGGYVDTAGNEYALVGTYQGLSIVNVTNPASPFIRFSVPGVQNDWREVKTYRKYAYVTTEGGNGLQVIDLSHLPDTIYYKNYRGDGAIANQLNTIHALHCDTATGYLYLYGSNLNNGGTIFISLADPWNPTYAGLYTFPGTGNSVYVHDGYASNDTLYEGHIYSGFFAVVDVRNKSNPVLLATQETPTAFTHNTWLSDDHKTLFTTDENSGSFLGAYDISDLTNIREVSRFQTTPGSGSIIHNTHILNDYAITSWYKDGVVITDVSRPANPIQVGRYDTYTQGSGDGFNGCWGVYPFLPSGTIVASDIDNGLYVLTPTYIRGCYLEGLITDSVTGSILSGATIQLVSTSLSASSDAVGVYRTGTVNAGSYSIIVSKAGYFTKTVTGIVLNNGVLTTVDVQLAPVQTFQYTGLVTDSASGDPVEGAEIIITGSGLTYSAVSDASGQFTVNAIPDNYTMYAGKWGYRTTCQSATLSMGGGALQATIAQGYYDDFTFDYGWTVSGSSLNAWQRGEPVGTQDNSGTQVNPENDVQTDCSDTCWVTDNGGAPYNNSDVDNGNTILTSPVFDGTIYQNPVLSYYRWYLNFNGVGTPNDTMKIRVSNGSTTAVVENVTPNASGNGTWVYHSVNLGSLLTLTSTMQFTVEVADLAPGNITEGALDKFEITGTLINKLPESLSVQSFSAYPNPFTLQISISYKLNTYTSPVELAICDLSGRKVESVLLNSIQGEIRTGQNLAPGVYFINLVSGTSRKTIKAIKY